MAEHKVFVHLPLSLYGKYRRAVLAMPVGLELLVDHEALAPEFRSEREEIAAELRENRITCRFHAPFRDLHPAGHDPEAVGLARRRLEAAVELAPDFGVKSLVAHPSWDPRGDALDRAEWLDRAEAFWTGLQPVLDAAGARLGLENTFDPDPSLLRDLLARLEGAPFDFLFDTGHFNAYSNAPLTEWMEILGPRLTALHVHDNGGVLDEHLALGRGSFPWMDFFGQVRDLDRPLEWTIENLSIEDVVASLRFLGSTSGISEFGPLVEATSSQA
jgi:sugar phosphate isomerase/epimerase